ncbi:hypothetical protein LJR225_003708 [Phenylobacterium sp. LjRoot225]|uniref:hypothetical protein n=1 Tax=Phenylobacterium sp. LjRoot225 TaxID=3342285 RepID=UPI003ECC2209
MTEPTTVSIQAEDQAPARAAETARALIERQLWVLGRLAEAGLNVALAIERQAMAAADEGSGPEDSTPETVRPQPVQVVQGDLALAYGRAARAVRLTLALQARVIKDLQALDECEGRRQSGARAARQQLEAARKARVERIVERVIKAELADADEVDRLADEAYERLDDDDIYGDLMARPVSETIARICRDLGLSPDWSRLAEEAWAQAEIDAGVAASPLMALTWADPPPPAAICAAGPVRRPPPRPPRPDAASP